MNKVKTRDLAVGIMMVLSSILVLIAIWDLPDSSSATVTKSAADSG
jgi:hypothetical protein